MNNRGIHRLADMVGSQSVQSSSDGKVWVRAVPYQYYYGPINRLRAAISVISGSAVAVEWPEAGDLERALNR